MKRVLVLQRVYSALSQKYHAILDNTAIPLVSPSDSDKGHTTDHVDTSVSLGSEALIKIAVKTGLSMLFSLFRQNWVLSASTGQMSSCNDSY